MRIRTFGFGDSSVPVPFGAGLSLFLFCLTMSAAETSPGSGSGKESRSNLFFAFDNGVGRDLKWTPRQQAATLKALGFDGIGYTGIDRLDERQMAFHDAGLKIFSLYVSCYVDNPTPYDGRLKEAIRQLRSTDTIPRGIGLPAAGSPSFRAVTPRICL